MKHTGERVPLFIKCAGCGEQQHAHLSAIPAQLEEAPLYVLCSACYVAIRSGYQRDRDRRMTGIPDYVIDNG